MTHHNYVSFREKTPKEHYIILLIHTSVMDDIRWGSDRI